MKINKLLEFYTIFARKYPNFTSRFAQKYFLDFFGWGHLPPPLSVSCAYGLQQINYYNTNIEI